MSEIQGASTSTYPSLFSSKENKVLDNYFVSFERNGVFLNFYYFN